MLLKSFETAINAVMPFVIYLALGWLAVRIRAADRPFMERLNRFGFKMLFPFMTFSSVYSASPEDLPSLKLMLYAGIGIVALVLLLMAVVPLFVKENARRGVVVQAIFRSNFVIYGIPMTVAVCGDKAGSMAGVMILECVSIFNIAAVIVLEFFNRPDGAEGQKSKVNLLHLTANLLKNPLLQGCLLGLLFFALGIKLPAALEKPVTTLGNIASPLAMITLGGTLQFSAIRKNRGIITPVMGIRLLAMPLAFVGLAYLLGLREAELFLVLMIFGTPIATSSYPMAANMGGDGELAGQLVFISTLLSLATIFGFIFAMSCLGLLPPA